MTHPLLVAIESNDLEGFKKELHATLDKQGGKAALQALPTAKGFSPTTLAASLGRADMVKAMVDAELDMNLKDRRLKTPLHEAASNGHADVVKILRQTPFVKMDTLTVLLAAEGGHVGVLRELRDGGADMMLARGGRFGNSATHCAAQGGNATAVRELYENWGASLMERNSNGDTPAHSAAANNKPDVIREIGRLRGARALVVENNDGNQPIHVAASAGFVDVVRALAEAGVPLDVPNRHGITPAMAAAASLGRQMPANPMAPRHEEAESRPDLVLEVLRQRGVAVPELPDAQWQRLLVRSPLMPSGLPAAGGVALYERSPLMPSGLPAAGGVALFGRAPLMASGLPAEGGGALRGLSVPGGGALPGSLLIHERSAGRQDVAFEAIRTGDMALLDQRLAQLARFPSAHVHLSGMRDEQGRSLATFAAELNRVHAIDRLVDARVDLVSPDDKGNTPIHAAAHFGRVEAIDAIARRLKPGHIEARNSAGETPAFLVAAAGHVALVREMVDQGVNVYIPNNDGNHAGHVAAFRGHARMFEAGALDDPAQLSTPNAVGLTAVHVAALHRRTEVLEAMVRLGVPMPRGPQDWPHDPTGARYPLWQRDVSQAVGAVAMDKLKAAGHGNLAADLECQVALQPFTPAGEFRPVRLPSVVREKSAEVPGFEVPGSVVSAGVVERILLPPTLGEYGCPPARDPFTHETLDPNGFPGFEASDAFRRGDPQRLALVKAVHDIYSEGGDVAGRAGRAAAAANALMPPPPAAAPGPVANGPADPGHYTAVLADQARGASPTTGASPAQGTRGPAPAAMT